MIIVQRRRVATNYDTDAQTYITAVETADGQSLEAAVRNAINAFVVGCKTDGNWNAIKAGCILAGARTLAGIAVPLAGTAPTNINFVSADYNRKTGLLGNGSSKYLDSNRSNNADPQNNFHLAVYASSVGTTGGSSTPSFYAGYADPTPGNSTSLGRFTGQLYARVRDESVNLVAMSAGLLGCARSSSTGYQVRSNQATSSFTEASTSPSSGNIWIFARNWPPGSGSFHTDARLAFYSIGESLDLAQLDARVTALINAFGTAIP